MRMQNGHNVPFLESVSFKKRNRKAMTRIKQIAKMFNPFASIGQPVRPRARSRLGTFV